MAKFARGRLKAGIICLLFRQRPPRLYAYYLLLGACCLWTCLTGIRMIQDLFWEDSYSCPPAVEVEPQRSICFVTSIFGQDLKRADKPSNVKDLIDCSRYRFFIFTNLRRLNAPGWTKIVKDDLPYQRMITQSRWGKFLAWQEPQVRHSCRIVFYMDGYVKPRLLDSTEHKLFEGLAGNLTQKGTVGLAQVLHPTFQGLSLEEIFQGILFRNKDVPENTNVTFKWLQSQPDYQTHLPYYLNKYFAYDPRSATFQKLSTYFWGQYSSEVGSWRDQPMWAYTLHHFNVTPIVLTSKGNIEKGGDLFKHGGRMGWKGHVYKKD